MKNSEVLLKDFFDKKNDELLNEKGVKVEFENAVKDEKVGLKNCVGAQVKKFFGHLKKATLYTTFGLAGAVFALSSCTDEVVTPEPTPIPQPEPETEVADGDMNFSIKYISSQQEMERLYSLLPEKYQKLAKMHSIKEEDIPLEDKTYEERKDGLYYNCMFLYNFSNEDFLKYLADAEIEDSAYIDVDGKIEYYTCPQFEIYSVEKLQELIDNYDLRGHSFGVSALTPSDFVVSGCASYIKDWVDEYYQEMKNYCDNVMIETKIRRTFNGIHSAKEILNLYVEPSKDGELTFVYNNQNMYYYDPQKGLKETTFSTWFNTENVKGIDKIIDNSFGEQYIFDVKSYREELSNN